MLYTLNSGPALVVRISAPEHAKHWYFTEAKSTELQAVFTLFLAYHMKDFMKSLSLMGTFLNVKRETFPETHPNCKARNKWGGGKNAVGVCKQLTPLSVTWQSDTQRVIPTLQSLISSHWTEWGGNEDIRVRKKKPQKPSCETWLIQLR